MEYLYNCIRQQIISIALRSTDKKAHVLKFNNGNANRVVNVTLLNTPEVYLIVKAVILYFFFAGIVSEFIV